MSIAVDSDVMFKEVIRGKALVLFYAPWCPFCRQFIPVFERLSSRDSQRFYTLNVDEFPQCESDYGIDIVPSVILFNNGEPTLRLDGEPGRGLGEKQLAALIAHAGLPD